MGYANSNPVCAYLGGGKPLTYVKYCCKLNTAVKNCLLKKSYITKYIKGIGRRETIINSE